MIEPSYANYHFSSPTPPADGLRNFLPTRSTIGLIRSECLRATSKGPTYDRITLTDEQLVTFGKMLDAFEDNDDVQDVYHNVLLPEVEEEE